MTIEQRTADALLQHPIEVEIGGRTYQAAPPTVATLIEASAHIARLPRQRLDRRHIAEETLRVARSCRPIADAAATLILGAKPPSLRFYQRDRHRRLADDILRHLSPSELHHLIARLLGGMEMADFFALTTFLTEVNLSRETKVETSEATAPGQ